MSNRRMQLGLWLAAVVLVAVVGGGCVERKLNITSDPAGAVVYLDGEEIGETPLEVPFEWYGDHDVILRKDGFNALKTHAKLCPPWYEVPPADFFSLLAPWTYRDHRYVHYKLMPFEPGPDNELIERAREMRRRNEDVVTD